MVIMWKLMNRKMRKILALGTVFCMVCTLLCGCGNGQTEQEENADLYPEIVVGCDNYAPFCYVDSDGQQTGIDVELATEAFRRMGYKANFAWIKWEEKDDRLKSGAIDCIWSSFSMDGREEDYNWAGPYMKSHHVIVVNPNSDIKSLTDLKGKTVAFQASTQTSQILNELNEKRNLQIGKVIATSKRELIFCFLSKGYADAIACYDTAIEQFEEDYGIKYHMLDEKLLSVGLGVAFSKDDTRGIEKKLSQVLSEMEKDGTIREIISRYLDDPDRYLEVAR